MMVNPLGKLYAYTDNHMKRLQYDVDFRNITESEYNEEVLWVTDYETALSKNIYNNAYTNGYMSYKDGLRITDHPYKENTKSHKDFISGYNDAKALKV